MKRLSLAAALAVALLGASVSETRANGGAGLGIGIGLNFNWAHWGAGNACNPCGSGCLPPPGWNPYYPPPMPYGGMMGFNPYPFFPAYGTFPFHSNFGGHDHGVMVLPGHGHGHGSPPVKPAAPAPKTIEK